MKKIGNLNQSNDYKDLIIKSKNNRKILNCSNPVIYSY